MKLTIRLLPGIILGAVLTAPLVARAAVPSLELAPLRYQATLQAGDPKTGYVTVSNPADTPVTVHSAVQGIRQVGSDGNLEFYDSATLAQGITISADNVQIPAHDAVNFQVLIDPDHLPQGGVYAAIFFQTVPKALGSGTQVLTSARVGTLLLLQNGNNGRQQGAVTKINLPWFTFGPSIDAELTYYNSGSVALNPKLKLNNGGAPQIADGPYILPQASRSFPVTVRGSQAGPVKLTVVDTITGRITHRWTFAITGYWRWALPLVIALGIVVLLRLRRRSR